jgi:ubiquitin C-terminal hydrolase
VDPYYRFEKSLQKALGSNASRSTTPPPIVPGAPKQRENEPNRRFKQRVERFKQRVERLENRVRPPLDGLAMDVKALVSRKSCGLSLEGESPPVHLLFGKDFLSRECLEWNDIKGCNSGIKNVQCTGYLCTILQCLFYTRPLTGYLIGLSPEKSHLKTFQDCVISALADRAKSLLDYGYDKPGITTENDASQQIRQRMQRTRKLDGTQFELESEEDESDFLAYMLEAMQESCMYGAFSRDKPEHQDWRTLYASLDRATLVGHIFVGIQYDMTRCLGCDHITTSSAYPVSQVPLFHAPNCRSIDDIIAQRFKTDRVDDAFCNRCNTRTVLEMSCRLLQMPNILIFKIEPKDYYSFSRTLDMSKYEFVAAAGTSTGISPSHFIPAKIRRGGGFSLFPW